MSLGITLDYAPTTMVGSFAGAIIGWFLVKTLGLSQ